MEKEEMKGLSDEELQQRIGSLLEAMRKERPEELERLKGIIRKSVPFFTRSAFSAYLLMLAAEGRKAPEKKGERRSRPDRPEKPRTASEPRQAQEKAKAEPKPERVIPEGAKTIYINVGKMKHLYAKDLSKLLQVLVRHHERGELPEGHREGLRHGYQRTHRICLIRGEEGRSERG